MKARQDVLLLTADATTAAQVAAALQDCARLSVDGTCHLLSELVDRLERDAAAAALVDIGPQPRRALAELEPIVARFPEVRFVLLSDRTDRDLILEGMQIGARHFLLKDRLAAELANVLERVVPDPEGRGEVNGSLITVLSASGGCGATTIAVNLANELGVRTSSPALVVDMDCHYGSVATSLGLSSSYSLADILAHQGRIDEELIVSTAKVYSPSLHALLSPATINFADPAPLRYERLESALEGFRLAYYHTVLDAPRIPMRIAGALAGASKLTVLVFQLNVRDLAGARQVLVALAREGVGTDTVLALANRYHRRGQMVRLEEAEKTLQVPVQRVSNDFSSAMRSANYGRPLAQASPRSSLRREVQRLAAQSVNPHALAAEVGRR